MPITRPRNITYDGAVIDARRAPVIFQRCAHNFLRIASNSTSTMASQTLGHTAAQTLKSKCRGPKYSSCQISTSEFAGDLFVRLRMIETNHSSRLEICPMCLERLIWISYQVVIKTWLRIHHQILVRSSSDPHLVERIILWEKCKNLIILFGNFKKYDISLLTRSLFIVYVPRNFPI